MTFKPMIIAALAATLLASTSPATGQSTGASSQSGADFGSASANKTDSDPKSDDVKVPAKATSEESGKPKDGPAEALKPNGKQDENKKAAAPQRAVSPDTAKPDDKKTATENSSSVPAAGKAEAKPEKADSAPQKAGIKKTEKDPIITGTTGIPLTVASWGGAYAESQKRAYFSPFENETGIKITSVSHKGKFDLLKDAQASSPSTWDIVDLDIGTLEQACKDGMLEKVAASDLDEATDGKPASSDFLPGTLHDCGVPSVAWSSVIVFDTRAFKKAQPKTAKDFFDIKRFPGKRALPRDPKYVLELALMADGVEPENVYSELAGKDGLERAFKQLDQIRDDIVWWNRAHEPIDLLARKDVALALAFNGRIFSAIVAGNRPFGIIWDGQVFDLDFWAIPKSSSRKEDSMKFIAFATRPESMAKQASWFPYGPVRKSAVSLVGSHPEVNVKMAEFLPTAPANFKRALRLDTNWWQENGENIREKYAMWIDGTQDASSFEDEQQQ